jgi:hypothetical protein
MVFGAKSSCNQPAILVVSFVGTNLLQDSNDSHAYDHDWYMESSGTSPTRVNNSKRRHENNPIRVSKVEAHNNSSSSPVQSPGAVCHKTDAQVAYKDRI